MADPPATQPLYERVKQHLRQAIEQGSITPGQMLPAQKELSAQFGVSGITVRRALQDLARDGVLRRISGVGTFVRSIKEPPRVALLVTAFEGANHWRPRSRTFTGMLAGVGEVAWESWKSFSLVRLADTDATRRFIEEQAWRSVDGVILRPHLALDPRLIDTLHALEMPFVLFRREFKDKPVSCVMTDDFSESEQLTLHLLNRGYRRIAFIGAPLTTTFEPKYAGYAAALRAHDVPIDDSIVIHSDDYALDKFSRRAEALLDRTDRPDAILCGLDTMAASALEAVAESRGIRVPNDLAIALHGPFGEEHDVSVTCAGHSQFTLGYECAQLLTKIIRNPGAPPIQVRLPAKLVVRRSTAPRLAPHDRIAMT